MALHLYFDAAATDQVSEGDMTNPDEAIGNGTDGFNDERELWIKNDDPTRTYKAVGELPAIRINTIGDDAQVNVTYAPDNAGSPGAWNDVLDLPDGAYTTPYKFWRRVSVSSGTPEQNRVNIKHQITGQRFVV